MPKKIVICSDCTGNTAIKGRGTNVFKLYEAVDLEGHKTDPAKIPQIAFYDDGVGTQRLRPLALFGGAFGWGRVRSSSEGSSAAPDWWSTPNRGRTSSRNFHWIW